MKRKLLALLLATTMVLSMSACTKDNTPKETPTNSVTIGETEPTPTGAYTMQPFVAPKELISSLVDKLISGDPSTVTSLFGQSDVYTVDSVKDRVAVTRIAFIDAIVDGETIADIASVEGKANTEITLNTHICTINYLATKEAAIEIKSRLATENPKITPEDLSAQVENEIASKTRNGDFDFHVTIPVVVKYDDLDGAVVITEQFKAAITGGWYNPTGAELISGECPINNNLTSGQANNTIIDQYKAPDMAPPESTLSPFDIAG